VRAAWLGGLAGLLVLGLVPCPFALFLRIPCPGCGLTRASWRLFQGDLDGALHFHPLVFVLLPGLAVFGAVSAWQYLRTGSHGTLAAGAGRRTNVLLIVFLVLLLGVWISRFFGAFGGPVEV